MYDDLDRPPLRSLPLRRALAPHGWRVEVLATTSSTNAVVAARARDGEPAGLVIVAEKQTSGRGRLDRVWLSPPRAGLTMSVLLRPEGPVSGWPWFPLLAGVAVTRMLREQAALAADLKWPNDVQVEGRKLAGLLAEVPVSGALVIGLGLNVSTRRDELPGPGATSLALEGAVTTDRDTLLRSLLRELSAVWADPAAGRREYRDRCATIGRQVRLELPAGVTLEGTATEVDEDGRLVVDGMAYAAGDVVHLRPR